MKLVKAYTIFTSRKFRWIMIGLLGAVILLNGLIKAFASELSYVFYIYVILLTGMIPLYGDMDVFAGFYGRQSGQVASLQSSFAGMHTVKLGILADRIFILMWVFLADLSLVIFRASYKSTNIYTLITGTGVVFVLLTISVNINRYFTTRWNVMMACAVEIVFVAAAALVLWLFSPYGNLFTSIAAILLTALFIWLTVIHAAYHLKRSYFDE